MGSTQSFRLRGGLGDHINFRIVRRGLRRLFVAAALSVLPAPLASQASSNVAIANQVDAILFYGQSNAGAGGSAKPLLTESRDSHVLTFRTFRQVYGSRLIDPKLLDGIGRLTDAPSYAPFPATAMGAALGAMLPFNRGNRSFFLHTTWYGSQPISSFFPGTTSWFDLLTVARRFKEVAARAGARPRVGAVVFIQGESGPSDRERYIEGLEKLVDDLSVHLREETRQDSKPVTMLVQTNLPASGPPPVPNGAWSAQVAVAERRPNDTILVGPMYHLPLADNIHQTAEGRMMLGEMLARAYTRRVLEGRPFRPLGPAAARIEGRTVLARFSRPQGNRPLRFDTAWVAPSPNYGFAVESDGRQVPIASVAIAGPDTVAVTLAEDVRGPLRLVYAQGQPPVQGWASGRGQLVSDSPAVSGFHKAGYKIPAMIPDYCIRFAIEVARP